MSVNYEVNELEDVLGENMLGEDIVTLTMDNGETVSCVVVGLFEAPNNREYIALLPKNGADAESGQVYLYRYSEDENEYPVLENIEDDEEFEIASDAFDEMLDSMEFDEMMEEDEL